MVVHASVESSRFGSCVQDRVLRVLFLSIGESPRDDPEANSQDRPYKYILSEIDLAQSLVLPMLVVADPRVRRTDGGDGAWLRMATDEGESPLEVARRIQNLWDLWQKPTAPHYVLFALDSDAAAERRQSGVPSGSYLSESQGCRP